MTFFRPLAFLALSLALSLGFPPGAIARTPEPIVNYENIPVPAARTPERVKQAILAAAATQKWTVTEDAQGKLSATMLVRGKHTVVVDIPYSERSFSVVYRDSVNMDYGTSPAGKPVIHPFYNRWAKQLAESISAQLA